jgi:hypothetical protein
MSYYETEAETAPANSEHVFLAMWDMLGLEYLMDVTAAEQENIVNTLRGDPVRHTNPIQMMILRARFNSQRHYEIYYFTSIMTEEEIRYAFQECPQTMVDAIRTHGEKVYSDRVQDHRVLIR